MGRLILYASKFIHMFSALEEQYIYIYICSNWIFQWVKRLKEVGPLSGTVG